MPTVTLLSDFGTREGFAAAMKGVILSIAPDADLVDVTHNIPRGDVEAGAWVLRQYADLYPPGTVHLAVVDPGVGSDRRPIAIAVADRFLVLPDNGIATRVVSAAGSWRGVQLAEPQYLRPRVSTTFHGRDIFAPVAAHLANEVELERLGPPLDTIRLLDLPTPRRQPAEVRGYVAHIDHFGNLITDIPADWVEPAWRFLVADRQLDGVKRSYADVEVEELVVVVGSMGTIEIAVRDGSAAGQLGASRGDLVVARS
jgi:S-adenosylmethionine hydrolase